MMEATNADHHHRNDSDSSYESVYSSDIDGIFVDDLIDPGDGGDEEYIQTQSATPQRQRLGAEMAIIAATSPEIKALNLPNSPTFPKNLENHPSYRHIYPSNSNDTFSSCSSSTSSSSVGLSYATKRRNKTAATLTPLIASMDDIESSPVASRSDISRQIDNRSSNNNNRPKLQQNPQNRSMEEETDELIRMLRSSTFKDVVPSKHCKARNDDDNDQNNNNNHNKKKKHVWFNEKENMYSNLLIKTNRNRDYSYKPPKLNFHVGGPQYEYGGGDHMKASNYNNKRPSSTTNICNNRRASLHRRASCNSLPSPAEIGLLSLDIPKPTVPPRRATSLESTAQNFPSVDQHEPMIHHQVTPRHFTFQSRTPIKNNGNNMPLLTGLP